MRRRFGYFTPDEYYEAFVAKLITEGVSWLDVGCGRSIFPNNFHLSQVLASRCKLLVGVDPDKTIEENPLLHEKFAGPIEDFCSNNQFDIVTLRMVAEHIVNPDATVESLARLTKPGGHVIIYTIYKWSPIPILTRCIPFPLHHPIKRWLWGTEAKDTFPVSYRMNTRNCLTQLFRTNGFAERYFVYLDDCSIFWNFRFLHFLELSLWRILRSIGLFYPENCLFAVYERRG